MSWRKPLVEVITIENALRAAAEEPKALAACESLPSALASLRRLSGLCSQHLDRLGKFAVEAPTDGGVEESQTAWLERLREANRNHPMAAQILRNALVGSGAAAKRSYDNASRFF